MECFASFLVVVRNAPQATQALERAVDTRGDLRLKDYMTSKNRPFGIKNRGDQVTWVYCGVSLLDTPHSISLGDSKTRCFEEDRLDFSGNEI